MRVIHEEGARPIHLWTEDIEESALQQLKNTARMPILHPHGVAVMPDVHFGIGATVGSVLATIGAIIPAAVGVDIGCGMMAVRTSLKAEDLPDSLDPLLHSIGRSVPLGTGGKHQGSAKLSLLYAAIETPPESVLAVDRQAKGKASEQLGTLGSGNHFIEICLDQSKDVWVMLHSGSRGIGNRIGMFYINKAKEQMERWRISLPDKDLAYLPDGTQEYKDYVEAVSWAQRYAASNRRFMMNEVLQCLMHQLKGRSFTTLDEAINCHHNYVEMENHYGKNCLVTRKGAIRARTGDLGIIPGSMGAKSYIVRGLGNPASYHSCSHGAGRKMGRNEARKRFTLDDLAEQTLGIACRKDKGVLDEIPAAYKNIDEVMENQKDLVEVLYTLKQVMCAKGD